MDASAFGLNLPAWDTVIAFCEALECEPNDFARPVLAPPS